VILSTGHAAKGCEYSSVTILSDMVETLKRDDIEMDENYRIAYVMATRTQGDVNIPNTMGDILSISFRDKVRGLPQA